MSHDIDDLLELIKMLEERIIELEKCVGTNRTPVNGDMFRAGEEYWEHG